MSRSLQVGDREKTAERLLNSSAKNSYDPDVDIDWDAPLAEDKFFVPEHRVSLYGTPLWDRMSREQRIELSKHEVGCVASVGIWFEVILMELLVRHVYHLDPKQRHVQYALTEIADECRHSIMFAKLVEKLGVPAYGPQRLPHVLGNVMKTIGRGPSMFASILIAEEILDRLQRESTMDETVQPLVRMVNRIHVLEEARHVRYAREELLRSMQKCSGPALQYHRFITARAAFVVSRSLVHPEVYRAVGLDPKEARRAALGNPNFRTTMGWAGERITGFLDEAGLIGGPGRALWRASGFLGQK
ncbi:MULTISPECIES: diiron oxygenase [unclassified Crossiella]|uniref:AurF N-oxygenase family protein n=1 Tax=unclassified Crossiella TaxID=2620835 RepID=UPI001FFF614C|nr:MULTISPECIES: diiron oxygenase [unclassified Crossiella]MCK2237284.1 diiron oxygenase [Crossiella sp. S99.2]MCK2250939.1 diiron oxygenase [Crossiella sp. S99.1]